MNLSPLDSDSPIEPRAFGCSVPLTAPQRLAWKFMNEAWSRPLSLRVCAVAAQISGPLNCDFLRKSIETVVQRHESLRTRFILVDGTPVQHIETPPENYDLNIIDLSTPTTCDAELEAKHQVQEFMERKVDLSSGPVFEARLWRLSEREHVFVVLIDHLVSDWISNAILNREIWRLYEQAEQGISFSLPVLPLQFADYAVWQQRTYDSWMRKHETYWKAHLMGGLPLEIPSDARSKDDDTKSPRGVTMHIPFGRDLSDRIRDVARREGTSRPVLALTAFAAVLSHWCGQRDFLLPFVSHGRYRRPELEPMIGFVSHILLTRIEVSERDTLRDLLGRVKREFCQALYHNDFDRVPDFIPRFQSASMQTSLHASLFQWRSASRAYPDKQQRFTQLRMQPFLVRLPDWKGLKLSVIFQDTNAGIFLTLYYSPHCLTSDTVKWFGTNVRLVLDALVQHPFASVQSVIMHRR